MKQERNFTQEKVRVRTKNQNEKVKKILDYWLLENMKVMEKLTVKEPISWSEQDWGG